MYTPSFIKTLVIALCAIAVMVTMSSTTVLARPPPSSPLLDIQEPRGGATYYVQELIHVRAVFKDGKKNPLYKDDTKIDFFIQKFIAMPDLNEHVGSISAKKFYESGFDFPVLESYLIPTQTSRPFRVRAHFDGPNSGYDDSDAFYLEK
ncbi:hypothetical protein K457DRAFT_141433 [Linnemannia elongata AG-77]|uniref:Uncharacterized protein n=1 Tax=Linnemannia elongata AG-77 TaxID=1314771 RepID=A0A197JIR3_9FUNG|nr:hypothetical protein K457DRAFT_141433 [Linnemannia elongata AG-77]